MRTPADTPTSIYRPRLKPVEAQPPREESSYDEAAMAGLDDAALVAGLNPIYLRDSCQCAACVDEHSGQKNFGTAEIPLNIAIEKVENKDDGTVEISWENDIPRSAAVGHTTSFSLAGMVEREKRNVRRPGQQPLRWDREIFEAAFTKVDYTRYMHEDDAYHEVLSQLEQYGLVVIENVPEDEKSVELVGEKIGPLRHTFYGRTWDVKDKPKAENVAYTSGYLGLHMDLLYMKQPPGLQLLHCIKSAGSGGESIFSDSFKATEDLLRNDPVNFDILSRMHLSYHYTKGGNSFFDIKTVFELQERGTRSSKAENQLDAMLNVNWSPQFQGPFTIRSLAQRGVDRMTPWLRAAKEFDRAINDPKNLFQYRLKEGDCVIFNNRRVLHGRTAFTSQPTDGARSAGDAVRWLKGAYLDHDDFYSQVRVMHAKKQAET